MEKSLEEVKALLKKFNAQLNKEIKEHKKILDSVNKSIADIEKKGHCTNNEILEMKEKLYKIMK